MEPKAIQTERKRPKAIKMKKKRPKRSRKGAKSDQNGAKRVPKGSQSATKMHTKNDVRKRVPKGPPAGLSAGAILVQNQPKSLSKIDQKIEKMMIFRSR